MAPAVAKPPCRATSSALRARLRFSFIAPATAGMPKAATRKVSAAPAVAAAIVERRFAEGVEAAEPQPDGPAHPKHVRTSYGERQNLTIGMHMRRFTRLTNTFSEEIDNDAHAVALQGYLQVPPHTAEAAVTRPR